eukprot:2570821-Amphidinium_carterae.1
MPWSANTLTVSSGQRLCCLVTLVLTSKPLRVRQKELDLAAARRSGTVVCWLAFRLFDRQGDGTISKKVPLAAAP